MDRTLALINSGPGCSAWCPSFDVVVYIVLQVYIGMVCRCRLVAKLEKGARYLELAICTKFAMSLDSLNDRLRCPSGADVNDMGTDEEHFKGL